MKSKALVVHSGGLDSTVLLYEMLSSFNVVSIGVDYGQRHVRELDMAQRVCDEEGIERITVELGALGFTASSQTNVTVDVPEGHYSADNMKTTIVPNRNMILLAIVAGVAVDRQIPVIAYGAHAGDHAVYLDCRQEFVDAMQLALDAANDYKVRLFAPFIQMSKTDIVRRGYNNCVPFEMTWSCYKGGDQACGRCGTCVERLEAFTLCDLVDPLEYQDREFWKTAAKL